MRGGVEANIARILPLIGAERQHCVRCLRSGKKDDKDNFTLCNEHTCKAAYCALCSGKIKTCLMCGLAFVSIYAGKMLEVPDSPRLPALFAPTPFLPGQGQQRGRGADLQRGGGRGGGRGGDSRGGKGRGAGGERRKSGEVQEVPRGRGLACVLKISECPIDSVTWLLCIHM